MNLALRGWHRNGHGTWVRRENPWWRRLPANVHECPSRNVTCRPASCAGYTNGRAIR